MCFRRLEGAIPYFFASFGGRMKFFLPLLSMAMQK